MRIELLNLLDLLQAPGPEPTLPDGPGDIPGYEVPRDTPSRALDSAEKWGPALATFIALGIIIFVIRKVIAAIPWKIVGPIAVVIAVAVYVAR